MPISSVDSYYDSIKNYSDLPKSLLNKTTHFFSHYKDLEKGKTVTVGELADVEKAKKSLRKVKISLH